MHLENKVALVSGVGLGMGSAIAMLFAQEGASVTLAARKTNVIQPLADDIHKLTGQEALALQLDAGKRSEIQNAVEQTVEKFGKLDIFVSLPGGGFSVPDALVDTGEDYFQRMLDNHLTTLFHGARAVPAL